MAVPGPAPGPPSAYPTVVHATERGPVACHLPAVPRTGSMMAPSARTTMTVGGSAGAWGTRSPTRVPTFGGAAVAAGVASGADACGAVAARATPAPPAPASAARREMVWHGRGCVIKAAP